MKRWLARLIALAGALAGASWFNKRRKQRAWEDEPRTAAEWPPLQMAESEATSVSTVRNDSIGARWIDPLPDGSCPSSHPVKTKTRSGIFHVEGNIAYERTNADRCYLSPDAAEADGYRAAKS